MLPFADTGSAGDDAHLAHGLAADILSGLATVPDFDVLAARETSRYRSGETRLRQLADELGATYAVEGSIRREGDRLDLTARLTDLSDLDMTWRDSMRGSMDDIFAFRDAVADAIAEKLLLGDAEVSAGPEIDLAAYEMYLRARTRGDAGDYAAARDFAERSLAITYSNPYARSYALLPRIPQAPAEPGRGNAAHRIRPRSGPRVRAGARAGYASSRLPGRAVAPGHASKGTKAAESQSLAQETSVKCRPFAALRSNV